MTQRIVTYYSILLLSIFFVTTSIAQKDRGNFDEGYITYDIKVVGIPEFAEFFRETTLTLYLKGNQSKIDLRIMGGFANMQLLSNNFNTVLMDLPMLPEKVSIPLIGEDDLFKSINVKTHTNHAPRNFGQLEYYEDDTRKIAKQPCYRAEIPYINSEGYILMYLAKKITLTEPIPLFKELGMNNSIPLSMDLSIEGIQVYLTATEIKKCEIEDEIFEVAEEYNQQTFKELKQSIQDVFGGVKREGVGL